MPSEEFFLSVQAIMKMPAEDLPYLHGVLQEAMRKQGLPMTAKGEVIDTSLLTQRALQLLNEKVELTGWEMALLAGVLLQFGDFTGADGSEISFESRSITGELRRYPHRNIANITSVMDSLVERVLVEVADGVRDKGAHRSYRITPKGQSEAHKLCEKNLRSAGAA
jgi:hypothetical protein